VPHPTSPERGIIVHRRTMRWVAVHHIPEIGLRLGHALTLLGTEWVQHLPREDMDLRQVIELTAAGALELLPLSSPPSSLRGHAPRPAAMLRWPPQLYRHP
jgi:hypothetical protein